MASNNKKYKSIENQYSQLMRTSQNTLEIMTKIDQALNNNDSYITAKLYDSAGKETETQIVTVSYLKTQIDILKNTIKTLSGVSGNPSVIQFGDGKYKRIIAADINTEPNPVTSIDQISTFKSDPNWIFDQFLNPKISIELDLTGKVDDDIRWIESKRFIVMFDKEVVVDSNGVETIQLTTLGAARKAEFEEKYKGKNTIDIVEFATWLDTPGLINRVDETLLDQDYFRVQPNKLKYNGNFTVLSTDLDLTNKKLWHILDTLTYYNTSDETSSPQPVQLAVGDFVNVIPNSKDVKATTVYKVVEISTITSQYKVRFELVTGADPIPVRVAALSIYSDRVPERKVRISIGYDEYNVIFIRPYDDDNNLIGKDWSPGTGFFTTELKYNNSNGITFGEFYVKEVYDYGTVLQDLVQKKVPNYYGIKPNAPTFESTNFKVVQINKHLTNSVDAEKIRDLHNQKNNLSKEIEQIQNSIDKQNKRIQTTHFENQADKTRANDELSTLSSKLNTKTQSKVTIIQDILAAKKNLNKIDPKFRARGFWAMPPAVISQNTEPQEVVQFEVWYRYLSKSGDENEILTISDLNNIAAQTSGTNTTVNQNLSTPKKINGAFSNWQKFKTDARKRSQDPITGQWLWHLEDVSDASTPNINQLDLGISPGEKIEIKIKSLSEVGFPDTPVESEFSEVFTIEFPDDLNNVLSDDQFILKEAQADDIKVKFDKDWEAKGLNDHLATSFRVQDVYYAHRSNVIDSGFQDPNGKIYNLYDYLVVLTSKINSLQETIDRAKGILEVYVVNAGNKTRIFNGNNINFNINLEDYMTKTKIGLQSDPKDSTARTYRNEIIVITDFSLIVKNAADSAKLGLLSNRGYGAPTGLLNSTFAYDGASDVSGTRGIQAIWTDNGGNIQYQDIDSNSAIPTSSAPRYNAMQVNNQWIWLEVKDVDGNYIYDSDSSQPADNFFGDAAADLATYGQSGFHTTLIKSNKNLGFLTKTSTATQVIAPVAVTGTEITSVIYPLNWEINETFETFANTTHKTPNGAFASTIHPSIQSFSDITDLSAQFLKLINAGDTNSINIPINIFAKPYTGTGIYKSAVTVDKKDKFDDTTTGADKLPILTALNNVDNSGSNFLKINLQNTIDSSDAAYGNIIKVNDRIVLNGLTDVDLSDANGKPLRVRTILSSTALELDFIVPSGFTTTTEANAVLKQVHKYNWPYQGAGYTYTNSGYELYPYTVLGQVATDERYVENYVEIKANSVNASPSIHTKSLRFYIEDENSVRPIEFQINWKITQYKRTSLTVINSNVLLSR